MTHSVIDWIRRYDDEDRPLIPAATVLLLRDGPEGMETLMMRRNSKLSFAEGMWVFPGGRIDPADHPANSHDEAVAAANAAVREAKEEANLDIELASLVRYSHWIPPLQAPKRFSTWFFIARAPEGEVTVDKGEILEHAWWQPARALEWAQHRRIEILPPTWMSLHHMAQFDSTDQLLIHAGQREPKVFVTRVLQTDDGLATMWEDDAAFANGNADTPGHRHRLVMANTGWRLEQR